MRVDCLENAQFWLSFFPVSEISMTVLKLISFDSDLKSELLKEKLENWQKIVFTFFDLFDKIQSGFFT